MPEPPSPFSAKAFNYSREAGLNIIELERRAIQT